MQTFQGYIHVYLQYTAHAVASGAGRNGRVVSEDEGAAALDLELTTPMALGGTGYGHNPEQLFASGYACVLVFLPSPHSSDLVLIVSFLSACFLGALQLVAGQRGKKSAVENAKVHVNVHIGEPNEKPGVGLAVDIKVEGVTSEELIQAAHEVPINPSI